MEKQELLGYSVHCRGQANIRVRVSGENGEPVYKDITKAAFQKAADAGSLTGPLVTLALQALQNDKCARDPGWGAPS